MGSLATTLLVVAIAIGALSVAAVALVAARSGGPLRARHVLVPLAVLAVAAGVVSVVLMIASWPRFLFPVSHLAYLATTLAVPAVGVAIGVLAVRWRAGWLAALVVLALVVPAPVGWYASRVAPYRLRVVEAPLALPPQRAGTDPIRVGVLADIQATKVTGYEQRAVTDLLALHPDVILLPGDVFQGSPAEFRAQLPSFRRLLRRLHAPAWVFAVRGDVDIGDRLDQLVEGSDIRILDDEVVTLRIGDRTVRLGGNGLRYAPPIAVAVRDDLQASDPAAVRILVAHRPDAVLRLPASSGVDLTVAGHTHGGQVAIPGFGPLLTLSSVPRSIAAGGLHEVAGNPIFVSSGVGLARAQAPQVRLFTRPMVAVVVLR